MSPSILSPENKTDKMKSAEPMTVLLRPRNFFTQNPCLDVPPSYSSTPTQMAAGKGGIKGVVDNISRLAFGNSTKGGSNDCGCK